jgi:hypothetical protein
MTSKNTVTTQEEDYLEIDARIPGQNYVCMSFISPEDTLTQRELFFFNRYMNQTCGELDLAIDEAVKNAGEEFNDKITKELKTKLKGHLKYSYNQFKDKFDDFKYKFNDELEEQLKSFSNFRTNIRGVKVRGVFDTHAEAEKTAKKLQNRDRSFHVFVGQMGYWLPWDPCADRIENEEYLETELNTLMKEYKENEIKKDLFYEDQKRDSKNDAMREKMENEKKQKEEATSLTVDTIDNATASLNEEDPWMKAKFEGAVEEAVVEEAVVEEAVIEEAVIGEGQPEMKVI